MKNEYAFPNSYETRRMGQSTVHYCDGMTLRDYFAGRALVMIAPFSTFDEVFNKPEAIARAVYKIADAMLAEREKK